MASEVGRDQGKSAFVWDVLTKDRQANTEAVNRAWTKAGHKGTISESLVNKIRSRMGLTGQPRPGARVPEGAGSAEPPAAPAPRRRTGPKRVGGSPPAKGDGRHVPRVTESEAGPQEAGSQSGGDDRTRVLTRLEGRIDGMLFEIKVVGGLPEFEEALRRARRILARSHGGYKESTQNKLVNFRAEPYNDPMVPSNAIATVREKYEALGPLMDERVCRCWAACEAKSLGWGGVTAVARATGLSRTTIRSGLAELEQSPTGPSAQPGGKRRTRRRGGGRPRLTHSDRTLLCDLKALVEPATRGDPQSPLQWTCKSTYHLADELVHQGHQVSHDTVARLLEEMDYRLQANRKTREGSDHPDRNAQFEYINRRVKAFQKRGQPVVSVDTKTKEWIGDFKDPGREWRPQGSPEPVRTHDFKDKELGKGIPYGIYDMTCHNGWVSVGVDHDTARFATATLRRWWQKMGSLTYPDAQELLVTADAGGSNGSRCRLWKVALQELADAIGLRISVCHFPPGTSKWNKIEHRMFCQITENWRGRPLISRAVIVNLIGNTTTRTGLRIKAELDTNHYETGIKVTDEELASVRIRRAKFHGEWNYTIQPRR